MESPLIDSFPDFNDAFPMGDDVGEDSYMLRSSPAWGSEEDSWTTDIPADECTEPDNEKNRKSLLKVINFHTNRHIPFFYKENHNMPSEFVKNVVRDVKKSIYKGDVSEEYIIDLVKAAWKEWTTPYSASSSQGRSKALSPMHPLMEWRENISTYEWGEVDDKEDRKAFAKAIKFHTRRYIPIIYKDSHELPKKCVQNVVCALVETFWMRYVDEDYTTRLIKAAWSGHKNELQRKYIKDKDYETTKAISPSPFVTNEDWAQFVEMCTASEYKAICAKNAANRGRKKAPSAPDGHNLDEVCSEIAMENVNRDAEEVTTEVNVTLHSNAKKRRMRRVQATSN